MKRANGTGSIVRKKGRSRPYIVYAPAKTENGKRVTPYLGSFKLKTDAQRFLEEFNQDPTVFRSTMSFSQVYADFKKSKRYEMLSKSTKDGYAAAYKHCAKLEKFQFGELRTTQLQEIIDDMEEAEFSFSSIHKVKVLFTVLSNYALQNDIIKKEYASFVILPENDAKAKRSMTDIEVEKIRIAAKSKNRNAEWVLYLICSGWRISEMLELTRFSYDKKEKTFCGGKKTRNGKNRLVPVYPYVQSIVEKQLSKNGETVFCMDDGKPMTANYFRKFVFNPLVEELKLDPSLTPHNTRHTFATLLKRGGADEFYRKRLLGHSSGNVTDDVYTHEDVESLKKALDCLNIKEKAEKKERKEAEPLSAAG